MARALFRRPHVRPPQLHWYLVHPLLVAAYPAVFLFATNAPEQVSLDPLWLPLAATLAGALAVSAVLGFAMRDLLIGSLVASLLVVAFFGYGHAWNLAGGTLGSETTLLAAVAVVLIGGTAGILRLRPHRDAARQLARGLTILAALGVAINGAAAASAVLDVDDHRPAPAAAAGGQAAGEIQMPDIYYLIFDRYAGPGVLERLYGFDNGPFLDELAARGFYVARESRANYLRTPLSLVSSLSMDYLDGRQLRAEAESPGGGNPIDRRLRGVLPVPHFLKELGYRYLHVGGQWEPTATNADADVTMRYAGFSQFAAALVETTVLGVLTPDAGPADEWTGPNIRAQTLYQFDRLAETRHAAGPKYVFAHFLLPHPPYVFDIDGSYPTQAELTERGNDASYIRQLQYANRRILELIDTLLDAGRDPVIILQADEGPWPERFREEGAEFQWREATFDELDEKTAILNAYRLPGVAAREAGLYPAITPVNSFRVVFNAYFGTNHPLLPDRYYAHVDSRHFYDFIDVTGRLRGRS